MDGGHFAEGVYGVAALDGGVFFWGIDDFFGLVRNGATFGLDFYGLEFYADFGEVEGAEVEVWAEGGCFYDLTGGFVAEGLYAHDIASDRHFSEDEGSFFVGEGAGDEFVSPVEANTYVGEGLFGGAIFEGAADGALEGGL
jgi:hypothetical protein